MYMNSYLEFMFREINRRIVKFILGLYYTNCKPFLFHISFHDLWYLVSIEDQNTLHMQHLSDTSYAFLNALFIVKFVVVIWCKEIV